ncbi:plasma membrane-associated cation-binding protein 1-like [Musa acuminata AAA Group]|uniref:plasma membrane-associated cation-binding protein 1-like n=1 Tax=Musa acuminata AAA Group TaxID=214697 RepID=UPI0031D26A20
MVNYWKSKVLPTIKKVFDRNGKKAAAAEACKSFDESKEDISKEFEEKKTDLQPKVVEIYEASAVEIKPSANTCFGRRQTLVKKPTGSGLKKKSTVVIKFIEELVKIEFLGSKPVSEAAAKYGPGLVSGPVIFLFEQVSTLLPAEEPPAPAEPAVESTSKDITPETAEEIKKEEAEAEVEEAPAPADPAPSDPSPETEKPAEPAAEPAKA